MDSKKECNIVKDLLIGYSDGILSEDSKELVENHLKRCISCKNLLEEINGEKLNEADMQSKEIDYLRKVRKKINKKNIVMIIIGIILLITILFNVIVFINYKITARNMTIFLELNITEEQRLNIENAIKEIDNDAEIIYYDQNDKLEELKEKLGKNADIVDGFTYPAHYEVKSNLTEEIQTYMMDKPGVDGIISNINRNPYDVMFNN